MPRRRLPVIAPQCATRYSAKPILLGRRLSAARLASYRPNETRKLTRDRSDGDRLELASPDQRSVAPVETALRLPGDLAHLWRRCRDLLLFGNANTGRMLIAPGALHERASRSRLPDFVMGPRLIVSPVELSEDPMPRYPISSGAV